VTDTRHQAKFWLRVLAAGRLPMRIQHPEAWRTEEMATT
jgi:hypothetical protein